MGLLKVQKQGRGENTTKLPYYGKTVVKLWSWTNYFQIPSFSRHFIVGVRLQIWNKERHKQWAYPQWAYPLPTKADYQEVLMYFLIKCLQIN